MTHSQYVQDLIRVNTDNKVPTWPTETLRFTAGSTQPLVMSASISKSSCFILIFPPSPRFPRQLSTHSPSSVILPLPLTLTFQATISLSPTLSINICLWVCLPPPSPALFWREQGNFPSPVDVNTHSRLGVPQLQELTDQGFYCHTRLIEDICIVHSINSPCCQTQTHLSANKN